MERPQLESYECPIVFIPKVVEVPLGHGRQTKRGKPAPTMLGQGKNGRLVNQT
jgi:hypothetical protein